MSELIVGLICFIAIAILGLKLMFVKESQNIAIKLFSGQFSQIGGMANNAYSAITQFSQLGLGAGALGVSAMSGVKSGLTNALSRGASSMSNNNSSSPIGSASRLLGNTGQQLINKTSSIDRGVQSNIHKISLSALDVKSNWQDYKKNGPFDNNPQTNSSFPSPSKMEEALRAKSNQTSINPQTSTPATPSSGTPQPTSVQPQDGLKLSADQMAEQLKGKK
jgi:hypothetical protein